MKILWVTFVAIGILMISAPTSIAQTTFVDGKDYTTLHSPIRTTAPDAIEVRVFFWFGSAPSNQLFKQVSQWQRNLPDDVSVQYTPVIFPNNQVQMKLDATAFYTAELMGMTDNFQPNVYRYIHEQRKTLRTERAWQALFGELGYDKNQFTKASRSFVVQAKVRQSLSFTRSANVHELPTIIVAGKYKVTLRSTGGAGNTLKVLGFLIEKERRNNK